MKTFLSVSVNCVTIKLPQSRVNGSSMIGRTKPSSVT